MVQYPNDKDPDDISDYQLSWTPILGADTISSITSVGIEPITDPLLTEDVAKRTNTVNSTTVWLGGGLAGTTYIISVQILTAGGRTFERSAKLKCKEL